jgi:precorrin-4/cobalt-precorrin-4 C11-methyltransferase
MNVTFVGAGPGNKELITLKGYNALKEADIVIWAGSLVNPELLEYCKAGCEIHDSAYMNLGEIIEVCRRGTSEEKKVVRLHTGDFSLFGSLREQAEELDKFNIGYDLIPGVSSFLGAASAVKAEYTVPEISQSLIITRMEGRTPVPAGESIESFATHGTSMVIFLSVSFIGKIVDKLLMGKYTKDTPIAVVFKATWADEQIIRGTLSDIEQKVKDAGITKTALIMVGDFLGNSFNYSKLYDEEFKHEYRK